MVLSLKAIWIRWVSVSHVSVVSRAWNLFCATASLYMPSPPEVTTPLCDKESVCREAAFRPTCDCRADFIGSNL